MNRRVVVIGAGLGGLSTAAHLVGRGYEVVVIERDNEPGGRAGRLEIDGYTFDTGPTVITMPDLLRSTFAAVDADLDDVVDLVALDPVYRACFADGSVLHVRSGEAAMTQEIREVCGTARGRRVRTVLRVVAHALRNRDAELHRSQLRLGARSGATTAARARAAPHGRLRALAAQG